MKRFWRHELSAVYTLWLRDMIRFVRDPGRMIGMIGQPLIFLAILGTGFGSAFQFLSNQELAYLPFVFPGILGMTVLFTALFSSVSVIWDRQFGFLKEMLAAPVTRTAIVAGKVAGGTTMAVIQGLLLLALAPFMGLSLSWPVVLQVILLMIMIAFTISGLGLAIASRMESFEGFQMIMNFVVMPMFLLSGAFFPLNDVPPWMGWLALANPLTYGVDGLRGVLMASSGEGIVLFNPWFNALIVAVAGVVAVGVAVWAFQQRE